MKTHTVVKNVKAACPEGMTKLSQMNKSDAMKIRSNFHYFFNIGGVRACCDLVISHTPPLTLSEDYISCRITGPSHASTE